MRDDSKLKLPDRGRPWGHWCRVAALWLGCLLVAATARAHKPSDSYLRLSVSNDVVSGQWDIALRDLEYVLGLDADEDGQITWGELKARHADVSAFAFSRLRLHSGTNRMEPAVVDQLVANRTDGAYSVLRFEARAPSALESLQVEYRLFFDIDPLHRGLLNLTWLGATNALATAGATLGTNTPAVPGRDIGTNVVEHQRTLPPPGEPGVLTAIFSPEEPIQAFTLASTREATGFGHYLVEGVHHIWIGTDHILFLLSLLLPAVFFLAPGPRRGSGLVLQPHSRFRPAFVGVLKVVTAFTLAHSITLSLAALGVVGLPSRLVESTIAASIVVAAVNNLRPFFHDRAWVVAFGFGLIHGFGFASVLVDLGLPKGTLAMALVAFNLGVEFGQLSIVVVFLPLAFAFRKTWLYRRLIFVGGSAVIIGIALGWFVERAFDMKFMPGF